MKANALLALAVGLVISAGALAADSYMISFKLSHHGREFAAPVVTTMPGQEARISVSGADAYTLAVTTEPLADGTLRTSSRIQSTHGDMAPIVVIGPGKTARLSDGPMTLELTVQPTVD